MNKGEVERLGRLEIEVGNNTKQLEKITTNDLPHIYRIISSVKAKVWYILGVLVILVPLVIAILARVW